MRRKVRSLVCAWMVVVLDAAVPPYAVGVSGERGEGAAYRRVLLRRATGPKRSSRIGSPKTSLTPIWRRYGAMASGGCTEVPRSIGR